MSGTLPLVAFLDASVLYPALLRNLLMHLAVRDLFQARWSDRVHEEWIAALLRNRRDLTPTQLARTRKLMDENVDDALVDGYEHIVGQLMLPDPKRSLSCAGGSCRRIERALQLRTSAHVGRRVAHPVAMQFPLGENALTMASRRSDRPRRYLLQLVSSSMSGPAAIVAPVARPVLPAWSGATPPS
jgi:hypothetical protein